MAHLLTDKAVKILILKTRYSTLSLLDSDPKSKHKLHIKIEREMRLILDELKKLE